MAELLRALAGFSSGAHMMVLSYLYSSSKVSNNLIVFSGLHGHDTQIICNAGKHTSHKMEIQKNWWYTLLISFTHTQECSRRN